jgi:hypothetical protein
VPGDVPQRKTVRVLPSLGQKRLAKRVSPAIRIGLNLIMQSAHLGSQDPELEFFIGMTGLRQMLLQYSSNFLFGMIYSGMISIALIEG